MGVTILVVLLPTSRNRLFNADAGRSAGRMASKPDVPHHAPRPTRRIELVSASAYTHSATLHMLCTPLAAGASVVDCPRSLANRTCAPDRQLCPARCRDMLLIDGLVLSRLVLRRPYNYHPVLQMPRAFHQAGRNSEHSLHTSAARTYTLCGNTHTHASFCWPCLRCSLTHSLTHCRCSLSPQARPRPRERRRPRHCCRSRRRRPTHHHLGHSHHHFRS